MDLTFDDFRAQYHEVFKKALEDYNIDILEEKYKSFNLPDRDLKTPLDQVFRDVLLELLQKGDVPELQQYVVFCINTCRRGLTTATMPVVLLGDTFDALTLNKCEQMFTFVENGVDTWKEELFFLSCKNNLLRMCNDLLRRLSRTQSTVFCGRILLFLAKFFPFSERSGLNIVSEFNLENTTEYGTDTASSLKETIAELDNTSEEKKFNIDFNLYCKFWALQDYFRNPNQCYNKVQWKAFSSHATNVLSAFSSCKLEDLQRNRTKPDEHQAFSFPDDQYFAKFLTSQKLLELQLSDANFRRCILVQFLILFQYLNSTVKFKSDSYELKPDQIEWVRKMTDLVYSLLEETPPDGEKFAQIVRNILRREEHWNAWKNDGCPEFRKPKPVQEGPEGSGEKRQVLKPRKPRKYLGDILKEAAAQKKYNLGNPELTKLWNLCPDNLEACKAKERDFLPQLDSYFSEAIEQLDPAAMVEDEYKKINDGNFGWRAIRLIARRSPQFFGYSNNPIAKQSEYLEMMIKRVAKVKQDNNEVDEESKAEDDQANKQTVDATIPVNVTMAEFENLISSLGEDWKTLALKLGFTQDEIKFFESSYPTPGKRAVHTLRLWFEDEGASIETFCDICDEIGHSEITETIKTQYINTIPAEFTKKDSPLDIENSASNPAPDSMDSIDFN